MNWKILTSPPPSTGWLLEPTMVAVLRRDGRAGVRCALSGVPENTFEIGPVGLQGVDRELLGQALAAIGERLPSERRAALVIPTAWVRAHLLDFDHLPRRRSEMEEVVRWRLKKLLPVRPADLRLSTVPQPATEGRRSLLCMVILERAIAEIEAAFGDAGVQLGMVAPRLFALASASSSLAARLVVQHEAGFLSMLLLAGDVPRLLRTKPLSSGEGMWQVMARELRLAIAFIRGSLQVQGTLSAAVIAEDPDLDEAMRDWLAEQEDVEVASRYPIPPCVEPGVVERLGPGRLAPVYEVMGG